VLTDLERRRIEVFLKNGKRDQAIRNLVHRTRKHLDQIKCDVALLEKLAARYREA
jgi:hypothetical protein